MHSLHLVMASGCASICESGKASPVPSLHKGEDHQRTLELMSIPASGRRAKRKLWETDTFLVRPLLQKLRMHQARVPPSTTSIGLSHIKTFYLCCFARFISWSQHGGCRGEVRICFKEQTASLRGTWPMILIPTCKGSRMLLCLTS